jgi:hypothetical protein
MDGRHHAIVVWCRSPRASHERVTGLAMATEITVLGGQ